MKCIKCGNETLDTISFSGLLDATVFACNSCLELNYLEFKERQRQFQELIDAGVSRSSANMIMISCIDEAAKS